MRLSIVEAARTTLPGGIFGRANHETCGVSGSVSEMKPELGESSIFSARSHAENLIPPDNLVFSHNGTIARISGYMVPTKTF